MVWKTISGGQKSVIQAPAKQWKTVSQPEQSKGTVSASSSSKKWVTVGPKQPAIDTEVDKYKKEADYANSARGLVTNTIKAMPQATWDIVGGNLARLAGSAIQTPSDVANGKFSDKKMDWMKYGGFTPTTTFQHEIGKTQQDVIEGKKGLGSLAWDIAQVPLAGADVKGITSGLGKGYEAYKGATGAWKGIKAAAPEVVDAFIPTTRGFNKGKVTDAVENISTETKLRRELAAKQMQKLQDALQTERPRPQEYRSGVKVQTSYPASPQQKVLADSAVDVLGARRYQESLINKAAKERQAIEESFSGGQLAEKNAGENGFEQYGGSMNLKRISEHSKEYRDYFKQYGSKPPLSWYKNQVAKEIKNGNHAASEEFSAVEDYIKTAESDNIASPFNEINGNVPINTKGKITTPKVNYKQVIEKNLGIQDKTPVTSGLNSEISQIEKQLANPDKLMVGDLAKDAPLSEDIGNYGKGMKDVYSNFKKAFGENYPKVKKAILDPFDKSKGDFIDTQKKWLDELKTKVVDNMGFDKGSEKSADLHKFGEGILNHQDIISKYGKGELGNFIHADNWFRKAYKQLLDDVNRSIAKIYPNQPEKLIPERQDYYRHFKEMQDGVEGLKNIFDTPAGISSSLAGVSRMTKPNQKWWSAAQQRLGNDTTYDATGGFLDYLKGAAYKQHIEPHIANFRNLQTSIGDTLEGTPQSGSFNNFQDYLTTFANDLSGKTNPADAFVQQFIPGGRKTMAIMGWANNRVKANSILGNVSSAVAQVFNLPMGMSKAGLSYVPGGIKDTLEGVFKGNEAMKNSSFLKERYFSGYDKFDKGILDNTKNFAAWMIGVGDEGATKLMWNTFHSKAIKEGISNAVKYADDMTREMVAGRGIGEVPIMQKAKIFQMVAPFQLEVQQLWHNMNGMVNEKEFGKLAEFFILNHLFNKGAEAIRGSGVSFDPIQAGIDSYGISQDSKDNKGVRIAGRMLGEVAGNMIGGQTLAGTGLPNTIAGKFTGDTVTNKELYGKEDPSRFGTGPLFLKATQDPYAIIPPFGGQQIKKTFQGGQSFMQGYGTDNKGNVTYPIDQNSANAVKSLLFGKYSTSDARNYFDQNQRAMTPDQSQLFKDIPRDQQIPYYNDINQIRDEETKQKQARTSMENDMRSAIEAGNNDFIAEIIKREPAYGIDLLKRLYKEIGNKNASVEYRKAIEDQNNTMKKFKLNSFYTQ